MSGNVANVVTKSFLTLSARLLNGFRKNTIHNRITAIRILLNFSESFSVSFC